jgi:outer membrane lipoprotein-sorting protein
MMKVALVALLLSVVVASVTEVQISQAELLKEAQEKNQSIETFNLVDGK